VLRQRRTDSPSLPLVGHLDRHGGDPGPIDILHIASHAHDRVVALIDCGERLVPNVVDVGKEDELAVGQFALRPKESSVA
jgi:hypothetical protein